MLKKKLDLLFRNAASPQSSCSDLLQVEHSDQNLTSSTNAADTTGVDVTFNRESTMTSQEQDVSLGQAPHVRRTSSEGLIPLQHDSLASSSSSPTPTANQIGFNRANEKMTQKFTYEPDTSEGGVHVNFQQDVHLTNDPKIKSSHQVGGLFEDSLQHALKINSITAGLKSKYLKQNQSDTKEEAKSAHQAVEPFVDASEEAAGSGHNIVDDTDVGAVKAAGDAIRISRSQDNVNSLNQAMKPFGSEPCLGNQSQNRNVNSHSGKDSCDVSISSSTHSFYATPSSSEHRPLNETYQINAPVSQQSQTETRESDNPVNDVRGQPEIHGGGIPFVIQVICVLISFSVFIWRHHSGHRNQNISKPGREHVSRYL